MTQPTYLQNRPRLLSDTECYRNFWCIGFKDPLTGKRVTLERTRTKELDRPRLAKIMRNYCLVGFNYLGYDLPMILSAMQGLSCEELKQRSNTLIPDKDNGEKFALFRPWQFLEHHGLIHHDFIDVIDLMEVSPGAPSKLSLKLSGGRLHSRTMRDLPYHHDDILSDYKISVIRDEYMPNDLDMTHDLMTELESQLDIRIKMSAKYAMDLRSKSDAQIAEAVIKKLVEKRAGRRIYKPDVRPMTFKFETPPFIRFTDPVLKDFLRRIEEADFKVDAAGKIIPPKCVSEGAKLTVHGTNYTVGIGGLHSNEKRASHYAKGGVLILDRDVRGYYPKQIIKSGRNPASMDPHFQPVFVGIVDKRDADKAMIDVCKEKGDMAGAKLAKDESETGKVMTNGTFGKTNQPGSVLYAPRMMIQTTVGGQLSVLMLIDDLGQAGFRVISANTDGFVTLVPEARRHIFEGIIFDWECETDLQTEETRYRSLHSRDVNSYVALIEKKGGKVEAKTKGQYAKCGPGQPAAMGLKKTPEAQVCSDAVVAYLMSGTPVEKTVMDATDVRDFVVVKRVDQGGCNFVNPETGEEEYLGKAVRWYYSTRVHVPLRNLKNGGSVGDSLGAWPMMTLPEDNALPDDLDYAWYIREAYARLEDAGVPVIDPALRGKTGTFLARYEDQKTVHIVEAGTATALCGRSRDSIREVWNVVDHAPEGRGMCKKCKTLDAL